MPPMSPSARDRPGTGPGKPQVTAGTRGAVRGHRSRRGNREPVAEIAIVEFDRDKYGRRLLVDAAPFHALTGFIITNHPHRLRFYEILFLAGGKGFVEQDGISTEVRPGRVCFTAPGDVRRWRLDEAPEGYAVLFDGDFLREFFSDARLVDELLFFGNGGDCTFLDCDSGGFARLLSIVEAMHRELAARDMRAMSDHILRALLYQLLVEIGRHRPPSPVVQGRRPDALPGRFHALVNAHYRNLRQVGQYAKALGVTASHLNHAVRSANGASASSAIHERLFLESRRLLLHTSRSVAAIALDLGFREPSYFNRFFKRMAGTTPRAFRLQAKSPSFSTKSDLKPNGG